jgi:hypothetical protein
MRTSGSVINIADVELEPRASARALLTHLHVGCRKVMAINESRRMGGGWPSPRPERP